MSPDWNAIRLDLLAVRRADADDTARDAAVFCEVRCPASWRGSTTRSDTTIPHAASSRMDAMQEAIRLQLHHWDLIASRRFRSRVHEFDSAVL